MISAITGGKLTLWSLSPRRFGPTPPGCVHPHKPLRLFLEAGIDRSDFPNQRRQPLWIEVKAVGVRKEVAKCHVGHQPVPEFSRDNTLVMSRLEKVTVPRSSAGQRRLDGEQSLLQDILHPVIKRTQQRGGAAQFQHGEFAEPADAGHLAGLLGSSLQSP